MRIVFERSGGFAGIQDVMTTDTNTLTLDEQNELKNLVETLIFLSFRQRHRCLKEGLITLSTKLRSSKTINHIQ